MRLRLLPTALLAATALFVGSSPASGGGGGCHDEAPRQPVAATEVSMVEACFRPGAVALSPGETLTITNDDPMLHNLYGPGWFAGDLAPGASMSRRFDRAGTYTFACLLHAGMTGAIVVGDLQPIAASTPAGGTRGDRDAGVSGELVAVTGLGLLLAGFAAGWKLRSGRQPASPDRGPAPAPAGTAG